MDISEIKNALKTPLYSAGSRSDSYQKRLKNISWIKDLDRSGLTFQEKERQLLIHTTESGEKIYIQYPGKESATHDRRGKERGDAVRPWDFRPKIYLPGIADYGKDLSFFDIWEILFEKAEWLIQNELREELKVLAVLLYRMAFIEDHELLEGHKFQYRDVDYVNYDAPALQMEEEKEFPPLYKYSPQKDVLEFISRHCSQWGQMSLEGFLYYNELLAWNEDCKYYYRNYHAKRTNKWINKTGRINNLLTHLRIIGYTLGKVHLSSVFSDFSRMRGVSAASNEEIASICEGYIES